MTTIDLRGGTAPAVRNQGRRPTCVPLAVTALHEFARMLEGNATADFAPEPIWADGLARGVAGGRGMDPWDTIGMVATDGQPALEVWPYNPFLGEGTEPEPASSIGSPRSLSQHRAAVGGPNDICEFLKKDQPVLVVIKVSRELHSCEELIVPEPTEFLEGAHAVLCVGTIEDPALGRLFLIRNSWGTHWGRDGYAYVSESYLTNQMLVAG